MKNQPYTTKYKKIHLMQSKNEIKFETHQISKSSNQNQEIKPKWNKPNGCLSDPILVSI